MITNATKKVGQTFMSTDPKNIVSKGMKTVNNFVQGEGYNPGRGAYYTLISAFVLVPRLMQAREPDEYREIVTRDIITVLTILFAMKGLKSGMCMAAQKNGGIPLVKDMVSKNAGKLERLKGYLNPEGGIIALNSDEIAARYSRFFNRDSLVGALETASDEGGNIAKMFSIEKQEGMFDKIKSHIPFLNKKAKEMPLYEAAKKMFGEGFESKTNEELIGAIKSITSADTEALEGLEAIIGKGALTRGTFDIVEKSGEQIAEGILNSKNNPLVYYAKNTSANFETLSLILTAGFLGLGLPKLNEVLTARKHLNKPKTNPKRNSMPINSNSAFKKPSVIEKTILKDTSMKAFQSFLGQKH